MRLGEMLVSDKRITNDDLERALAHQHKGGGRLGSILVEMGLIDAETLTVYLGLELGIPIATGASLERCKRSAVRLLTPEQAARLRCIPIVIQGQTLIVAVDDPHDMWVLDEISTLTGYRVLPRVAPEVRIFYYLERFYGVQRPPRWARLGDAPRGNRMITQGQRALPAPPLPGLPPRTAEPVAPPTPAPELQVAEDDEDEDSDEVPIPDLVAEPVVGETSEAISAIEIDAADLVEVLEGDEAETAGEASGSHSLSMVDRSRPRAGSIEYEPMELETAIAAIATCERRGDIADVALRYAASMVEVACLCMVRDNMAFGWKSFGPTVDSQRVEALLIPLASPSMFQSALHTEPMFQGRPYPATLHSYLFKVLRCPPPAQAVVIAIRIGNRPVNLLYGHKASGEPLTEDEASGLQQIAEATSEAYVRLISEAKQKHDESQTG